MKKIFLILFLAIPSIILGYQKDVDETKLTSHSSESSDHIKLNELLDDTDWKTKNVANGITWKYYQFPNIFDSRQSITLFDIDMSKDVKLDIPYLTKGNGFLKTSAFALATNADVAVNGGFFDTKNGGSTAYFKTKGKLINQSLSVFSNDHESVAFIINKLGKAKILKKPRNGWDQLKAPYILAGGPLLVFDGKAVPQFDLPFNTNRHPRTVIGITKNNHLLMLVNDGRSSESQGLSTIQLAALMVALGCKTAINMDGGGSSTAWVKGEGVVNHPSDNKKFDHEGERGVVTVITATAK